MVSTTQKPLLSPPTIVLRAMQGKSFLQCVSTILKSLRCRFYCPSPCIAPIPCNISGTYCPQQSASPLPCPPANYCPKPYDRAYICDAGSYCPGKTEYELPCPPGSFCRKGSVQPVSCPGGTFCPNANMSIPLPWCVCVTQHVMCRQLSTHTPCALASCLHAVLLGPFAPPPPRNREIAR